MIVLIKDITIGDPIATIPVVNKLAESNGAVYVRYANQAIWDLGIFRPNVYPLESLPGGKRPLNVISLSAHEAQLRGKMYHPIEHYARLAKITESVEIPTTPFIHIAEPGGFQPFDFLIAPWSAEPLRMVAAGHYTTFLYGIRNQFKGARIGILGSVDDPQNEYCFGKDVTYLYGLQLPLVARLMVDTKVAVVTMDSSMNRLAHAAAIKNHVLVCANEVPLAWGTWPGAHVGYYGPVIHPYSGSALGGAWEAIRKLADAVPSLR